MLNKKNQKNSYFSSNRFPNSQTFNTYLRVVFMNQARQGYETTRISGAGRSLTLKEFM